MPIDPAIVLREKLIREVATFLEERDDPESNRGSAKRLVDRIVALPEIAAALLREPAQPIASGEREAARDRHGLPCARCGHDCGMDAVVPNDVWAKISPTGHEGGMLCLWCMDEICVERGIGGPVPVKLYYPGRVLNSVPPSGDNRSWLERPAPERRDG